MGATENLLEGSERSIAVVSANISVMIYRSKVCISSRFIGLMYRSAAKSLNDEDLRRDRLEYERLCAQASAEA